MPNYPLENNRGGNKNNAKKKLDFKTCKKNTLNSLKEIEIFLNSLRKVSKAIKIKNILK